MTCGSLFSGIGGFDLGLERAGMEVRWQVERDEWCRNVLAKHWPDVKRYGDIHDLTGDELEPVDLICGGFPCQPVSVAGQQKGTDDDRWLWPEFKRLVGLLRPRYVLVENVPGLLTANGGHAFGEVLGDLADLGYDCEWTVLSAADVGAPHLRKRVWIVAHARYWKRGEDIPRTLDQPDGSNRSGQEIRRTRHAGQDGRARTLADADRDGRDTIQRGRVVSDTERQRQGQVWFPFKQSRTGDHGEVADAKRARPRLQSRHTETRGQRGEHSRASQPTLVSPDDRETRPEGIDTGREAVADAGCQSERRESIGPSRERFHGQEKRLGPSERDRPRNGGEAMADANGRGWDGERKSQQPPLEGSRWRQLNGCGPDGRFFDAEIGGQWEPEPDVGRVAHGIPKRVDRLRGLGNAVVPQCAEAIGHMIMARERLTCE